MKSKNISPPEERKIYNYTNFLKNLVALEKCETLITEIHDKIIRNDILRDCDFETTEKIKKLLINFEVCKQNILTCKQY